MKTAKMDMKDAINNAIELVLNKYPKSVCFGEDVSFGGVFRVTTGLLEKFGKDRVFNSPLSEQGIIAFAIGLAQAGYTVIPEI